MEHALTDLAETVVAHVSEQSVLNDIEARALVPYVVAGRKRFATCSGVAWFHGHHLAVVNLYGGHLRVYRFEPEGDEGQPRLTMVNQMSEGLSYPEMVAASSDGSLLAVVHSMSTTHGISLHPVDPISLAPRPARKMFRVGQAFHGLTFSPDARYLAFTEVGNPGYVEIARTDSGASKGIAFSPDGTFVVVAMAPNVLLEGAPTASGSLLAVHRFDARQGILASHPVTELRCTAAEVTVVESCTILPAVPGRPWRILAVDQAADRVSAFDFDAGHGRLVFAGLFASGMSFPHGIDISADGRYAAVANYGDDTLRIMRVAPDRP
jgi:6-phosphogluconolactonase (cycloisomerase 2 family)